MVLCVCDVFPIGLVQFGAVVLYSSRFVRPALIPCFQVAYISASSNVSVALHVLLKHKFSALTIFGRCFKDALKHLLILVSCFVA